MPVIYLLVGSCALCMSRTQQGISELMSLQTLCDFRALSGHASTALASTRKRVARGEHASPYGVTLL